ncbi:ornithine decarboxylase-like [Littorina saxatilis]|uniref:Orn/DAP/Arg decarboxylase 2 C-terminal domain-containing protein n=1 Tax=Littorina saxatilis TaxID=31220 RepID=A0AAN9GE31_9CAEN
MANEALDEYFPASGQVRIIGEPGRYMAEAAFTATPCVIAKRQISTTLGGDDREKEGESRTSFAYYVNDGVFGSFSCVLVDKAHPGIKARLVGTPVDPTEYPSVVYGHTMDGLDRIINDVMLPELQIGDVINFINMGAYSTTVSTSFNGMPRPLMFYHCCDSSWNQLSLETTD